MSKRKADGTLRDDTSSQKLKHERQRQAYIDSMHNFWQKQLDKIKNTDFKNLKQHDLPLARIKKIMRSDEDVKMISAEAPVLFAKACELFILDLTMRAWSHADAHRRKTLQREDVATAISGSEMFDFLLDVVPRQPANQNKSKDPSPDANSVADLASENASLENDPAQNSNHRLSRPMMNPLTPNPAPLHMLMPLPVEKKPLEQKKAVVEQKPAADPIFNGGARREWPQMPIGGHTSNLMLGPASTGSRNINMGLKLTTDPTKDGNP